MSTGASSKHFPHAYARLPQRERQFLDELRSEPLLGTLTVAEERARMRKGQTTRLQDYPVDVLTYPTTACPVTIIRPPHGGNDLPIMFFLHGGGWALGGLETHAMLLCQLAERSGRAIAFIDYPRAPETRFPKVIDACADALQETLNAAETLGLSAQNFLLAGDSAGGNLVLALMLTLQQNRGPLPAKLVLLYPVTDCATDSPSYLEFADDPNLSLQTMKWFWEQYLPSESVGTDPLVSPLRAEAGQLRGFPPTLIVTCEYDILRDQGEALAASLIEAGVEVTAVRWMGALHGFLVTESLLQSPSAQHCRDLVALYCRDTM